jgi:hypothetical protein
MPDEVHTPRPVQVFLDTRRFIDVEEPRSFAGGHRDFFDGNDAGFAAQKTRVGSRLRNIASTMRSRHEPAGFVHVQMREDALGKSYRPIGTLFTERHGFGLVGSGRVGEMIFQATPRALDDLDRLVEERAEPTPRRVRNRRTGEIELRVSGYRSEVGGIAELALHDSVDRVGFSAEEAIAWLRQTNTIGGYLVELFRPVSGQDSEAVRQLVEGLQLALVTLPFGLRVRPFLPSQDTRAFGDPPLAISVQLIGDPSHKEIALPFLETGQVVTTASERPSRARAETDLRASSHEAFLAMLSEQALVRSIELPPLVEAAPAGVAAPSMRPAIPPPAVRRNYPVVGIIDGGVASVSELAPWRAGEAGLVPDADRDENHGTFIAGLVVAGSTLNPHLSSFLEPHGCKFFDLDLFPRRELRQRYYAGDIDYFFDLLDEKIKVAKLEHRVRVFNLSFGLRLPTSRFGYSVVADRLDRLARANDVILIISAGNLRLGASRPPWSANASDVLAMLAVFSGEQKITSPAEHMLGLTVGALNPPNIRHEAHMPTTYTRRGPGTGGRAQTRSCSLRRRGTECDIRQPDGPGIGGTEGRAR